MMVDLKISLKRYFKRKFQVEILLFLYRQGISTKQSTEGKTLEFITPNRSTKKNGICFFSV